MDLQPAFVSTGRNERIEVVRFPLLVSPLRPPHHCLSSTLPMAGSSSRANTRSRFARVVTGLPLAGEFRLTISAKDDAFLDEPGHERFLTFRID